MDAGLFGDHGKEGCDYNDHVLNHEKFVSTVLAGHENDCEQLIFGLGNQMWAIIVGVSIALSCFLCAGRAMGQGPQ